MTQPSLGPGSAFAAWASVLVALNLTGHPWVVGATFAGLAALAVRSGRSRLVVLSLLVGVGLLLMVPGLARIDGSYDISFGAGAWDLPSGIGEWADAAGSSLRIPAQVLATVLLLLVPAQLLLAATSRLSPRAALLGGLVARLRPLLARDLRLVREELASRGLRIERGAPVGERARAVVALWEAAISGMLDRAFQTAAALETRGYGVARPTTAPMQHPELRDPHHSSRTVDAGLLLAATALLGSVLAGRATDALSAPAVQVLAPVTDPGGWSVYVAMVAGAALGLLPVLVRAGASTATAKPSRRPSSAPSGQQLDLRDVDMQYPNADSPSITGVSLRVAPGELVVVTGASGSGKSTLLDVVTGVAPRTTGGVRSGAVRLGHHVLDSLSGAGDARIAAVFQDPESQVLVGTVAEEVAFGPRHAGLDVVDIEARVLAVLDELDVRHLAQRDCATLSGGELQRVLLAAALALEPALLVLDEPTSQVDATSERRFWEAVDRARRERGVGVLAAEHRLDHVLHRADRVVVFDDGRIVGDLLPAQVDTHAPHLLADPYTQLVPQVVDPAAPVRLAVRIDRLDVEDDAAPRTLVRALSFAVPGRSIVTLEGPNGTGKSTLLRAIRGLHPIDGAVLADGRPRDDVGSRVASIAFLSQGAGAHLPGRTVRHAIEDTCLRLGIDVAAAHVALAAAGLADRVDDHPGELSVGERQRLALVAATAHRPAIWLLDEPTRGMDAIARRWVACHVLAHAAAGGVVLVATHDPALAAAIATHRLRLDLRTGPSLLGVARDHSGRLVEDATSLPTIDPTEVGA